MMTQATAGRVFISYRREDAGYPAGWLFDQLAARLGADRVFKDVDSIEPGDDFAEVITEAVRSCAVLLAVIGDRWLAAAGQDGRRLDDPGDFVRLEIEAALAQGVRVIPVLVSGARMPRPEQLPASLAALARRQAVELSHVRFSSDLASLLNVLDRALGPAPARPPSGRPLPARTSQEGKAPTAPRDAPAALLVPVSTMSGHEVARIPVQEAVSGSGVVTVGGDVKLQGTYVAGRDLTITQYLQERGPIVTSLFQLPPDVSDSTGRSSVRDELMSLLMLPADNAEAVVISSIAGVAGLRT
jgi:hypothetical protein